MGMKIDIEDFSEGKVIEVCTMEGSRMNEIKAKIESMVTTATTGIKGTKGIKIKAGVTKMVIKGSITLRSHYPTSKEVVTHS